MKIASFLRCGVVIVLLLVAGRAGAQLDSNSEVSLYCSQICDGCTMIVTHTSIFDTNKDTYPYSQSLCVGYNGSFRYSGIDSVSFVDGAFVAEFKIDSINKCFRNISFSSYGGTGVDSAPCYQYNTPGYFAQFVVQLDSLSYKDSLGTLSAHGIFSLNANFMGLVDCGTPHQSWNGGCRDTKLVIDTISIEIVPNGYLSVSQTATIPETRSIEILDQGIESSLGIFATSEYPRTLELYDLLGRNVALIQIPSSTEFIELPIASLPPGCYFAQLGDQVAKFVVPPK
jgi:hypothetical protein